MSNILIFKQGQEPQYLESVNTGDYLVQIPLNKKDAQNFAKPDVLINPDISNVVGVPKKYWKRSGNSVVEMTNAEKKAVDDAEKAKRIKEIEDLNFEGKEAISVLIDSGIVTKQQVVDSLKAKEGL